MRAILVRDLCVDQMKYCFTEVSEFNWTAAFDKYIKEVDR